MAISNLPPPPARSDTPANFITKADAFIAALPTFVIEANAQAAALTLNSTIDTSVTSTLIGLGAKTFTVSTGKSFQPGMYLVIADTAAPSTNSMSVQVTSYNSGTGALVVNVLTFMGSGTKTAWTISQSIDFTPLDNSVGTAKIQNDSVTTAKIADSNVTTAKIADSNVTTAKIADSNVTTAKIADANVTLAKLDNASKTSKIQPITASVSANALTVTLNPTTLDFRSSTLSSGTVSTVNNAAAISVVVPSTATLGTVSAVESRLVAVAINNAGVIELAVINITGGNDLSETGLISTTAISITATANNVFYSTTARTAVAYRVVGYIDSTQATAGTYATAPSTVQGFGGQALSALSSIGYGQVWTNMLSSRVKNTTYYNTTGKPIYLNVTVNTTSTSQSLTITVNGSLAYNNLGMNSFDQYGGCIIPPNVSYVVSGTFGGVIKSWLELR